MSSSIIASGAEQPQQSVSAVVGWLVGEYRWLGGCRRRLVTGERLADIRNRRLVRNSKRFFKCVSFVVVVVSGR